MKILINLWPRFVFARSGDLSINRELMALSAQYPDIEFQMIDSALVSILGNARLLVAKLLMRSGLFNIRWPMIDSLYCLQTLNYLPPSYAARVGADVVFAITQYPWPNPGDSVPLVAVQYLPPLDHYEKAGVTHFLSLDVRSMRLATGHVRALLTQTPGSKARMEHYLPELTGRVWHVPLYLPYIEPREDDEVARKHQRDDRVRVLFVGGEARRKGLPVLLQAFARLAESVRRQIEVTVVTNFRDGQVPEVDERIDVRSNVHVSQVMELMRQAHVFAFPTQYDSFGRVIVEAMANGCAIITSKAEPQDWMVNYGQAGILVDPDSADEVAEALTLFATDRQDRTSYGLAALSRFREVFHHRVVGAQYRSAFERALTERA